MQNAGSHRDGQCSEIEPLEGRTLFNSPLVLVANAAVRERGVGQVGYALVAVTLARRASAVVKIGFATKAGTATAGVDFESARGTLVIPAGSATGTIRVKIIGDNQIENSEKFYVRLTSAVHATLPIPAPYSIVRIVNNNPTAPPISNNLSAGSVGVQGAGINNLLAASFIAPSTAVRLEQVVLRMAGFSNTAPLVSLYRNDGGEPGTTIAHFNSVTSIPSTPAPTPFVNAGVVLIPGVKYWIVLSGSGGGLEWAFAGTNSGSGTGFTAEWASSVNGGTNWNVSVGSPLQMQVGGA